MSNGLTRPRRQFGHGEARVVGTEILRRMQDLGDGIWRLDIGTDATIFHEVLRGLYARGAHVVVFRGSWPGALSNIPRIAIFTQNAGLNLIELVRDLFPCKKNRRGSDHPHLIGAKEKVLVSPKQEEQVIRAIRLVLQASNMLK